MSLVASPGICYIYQLCQLEVHNNNYPSGCPPIIVLTHTYTYTHTHTHTHTYTHTHTHTQIAIVLGVERSSYTVQEADTTVQDLVALVNQEGIVTEQTITLAVSTIDISAKEGELLLIATEILIQNVHHLILQRWIIVVLNSWW